MGLWLNPINSGKGNAKKKINLYANSLTHIVTVTLVKKWKNLSQTDKSK